MANSNYSFSVMPTVSISRSKFLRTSEHKTTFNLGDIVPVYIDEVLPGDTRTLKVSSLVRMSTPISPIMDNIELDYFAFFIPNRLCWIHWKEFMGENNSGAGIPLVSYTVPEITVDVANLTAQSLSDYFGLPKDSSNYKVSALPYRAYALCYNRWFRNENLIAPLAVNTTDTDGVIVGSTVASGLSIQKASKFSDYFTSCLPYAQKGTAVSIPLGTTAPIVTAASRHGMGTNPISFGNSNSNPALGFSSGGFVGHGTDGTVGSYQSTAIDNLISGASPAGIYSSNLMVDLSNATAATINQLRYAFQLQKLLEKDAIYGTRYWSILAAHFGVTSPDASLQDPEYLGGQRVHINVDQVLSTAGYDDSSTTTVGCPGANSVTGSNGVLFTKSFTEHGWIMVCAVARHRQTYGQGVNRMWYRKDRYSFYFPVFANLGAQEVRVKEIYGPGSASANDIFGYQEAWAEYRYKPSIVSGELNPSRANSMSYWTLANNFLAKPTLGQTFIEQDRANIGRALVTSTTGPDFIADFHFVDEAVRPMPMYSIPGLIDHH